MRRTCFFLITGLFFSSANLVAQGYCSGDTVIFTESAHPVDFDDVVYKTAPQIDEWNFEVPENIRLRVYFPTDLPAGEKRPLVVLVHGGYFIWGSYLDFDAFAKSLAQKGFIAASIGYRLCKRGDCVIGASFNLPCQISWGNSFIPSAYVAAVDVNDGIRWLQERAADYHIDPEKVTVAGHSAGAFTALNVTFLDQVEIQQVIPSAGVSGKYLGEPLDPVQGIRACIPMSGAFLNLDWIEPEEVIGQNIAVGAIHGTSDGVVHYDEALAIPCCQTYNTIVHGGCDVLRRVRDLGGSYYMLSGEGFGHDIGESPWYDVLSVQMPAFVIKTVVCGQNIEKHSVVQRASPLPMCPANNPALVPAVLCDVAPATPPVTTPVQEAPGMRVDAALALRVYQSDGQVFIEATAPEANGAWQIDVFGMDGRLVRQFRLELSGSAALDLSETPASVYALLFRSLRDGRRGLVKVIKE